MNCLDFAADSIKPITGCTHYAQEKHDCEYLQLNTVPTDKQQPAVPWQLTARNGFICESL